MTKLAPVFASLLLAACGPEAPADTGDEEIQLDIFSWWTAPGEAEALDALVAAHHERFPNVTISNIVVTNVNDDPEALLHRRLFGDATTPPAPPDLMQWNVDNMKVKWVDAGVQFVSLDGLFQEEGWMDKFRPEVLEHCRVGAHIISLPVGLHRINSMIYGKQLLADVGVSAPPASWEAFVQACDRVTAAGKTCLAVTQEGWVQNILFQNVAVMTMGADGFSAYFNGAGDRDDPRIDQVVANYDYILDHYVGGRDKMRVSGWDEAAKDVFRGDTAFFMHGDWAVALLKTLGWNEQDFGVISAPAGARSIFIYTADGFMIPAGGKHLEAAFDVIRAFGSPATLAKFAAHKGASPPRTDVDVAADPLAAGVYAELQRADVVVQKPSANPSDAEFRDFMTHQMDRAGFVAAVRRSIYPE